MEWIPNLTNHGVCGTISEICKFLQIWEVSKSSIICAANFPIISYICSTQFWGLNFLKKHSKIKNFIFWNLPAIFRKLDLTSWANVGYYGEIFWQNRTDVFLHILDGKTQLSRSCIIDFLRWKSGTKFFLQNFRVDKPTFFL